MALSSPHLLHFGQSRIAAGVTDNPAAELTAQEIAERVKAAVAQAKSAA